MAEGRHRAESAEAAPKLRLVESGRQPLQQWSDEDLMMAHGEGSEAAYAELVRRHQRGILNYMYRMVQNRHVAEELTQEVFIALVKNGPRYRPTAKFTTYLYTIASNIVSKEWARQKRRPKLFNLSRLWTHDEEDEFDPIEQMADKRADVAARFQRDEINEAVNEALRHLPPHQREAFVLRRFREVPYEEMADILQVPVGTLKSRVVRAERGLRPYLSKFRDYL